MRLKISLPLPFTGLDRRTVLLRATLLSATLAGMLISAPLWINSRDFPVLPLFQGFPVLPAPLDRFAFGAMILSLVMAAWFYRAATGFFLAASLYAFFEDQMRGQPWFYMYWVLLLLSLARPAVSIAACRCALSVAYVWSGIQKLNPRFFGGVPAFFVAPAHDWHLPAAVVEVLRWGVATAPFLELGIGFALWVPRLRRAAIAAVVAVHAAALLFLGPLGRDYDAIVWPWNLAMIGLVWALFARFETKELADAQLPQLKHALHDLRQSKPALVVWALYSFLPLLSYAGRWDSAFSFTLYAENQANANVFVTQAFADRLPAKMRAYAHAYPSYDAKFQNPYIFMYNMWCYEQLHVPFAPEPRNFRSLFQFMRAYSKVPEDLRLIVDPRAGPVIFYQGDDFLFLARQ